MVRKWDGRRWDGRRWDGEEVGWWVRRMSACGCLCVLLLLPGSI